MQPNATKPGQPGQTMVVLSVANVRQQMEIAEKRKIFGLGVAGVVMGVLCLIVGVLALVFDILDSWGIVTSVGEGIMGGVFIIAASALGIVVGNQNKQASKSMMTRHMALNIFGCVMTVIMMILGAAIPFRSWNRIYYADYIVVVILCITFFSLLCMFGIASFGILLAAAIYNCRLNRTCCCQPMPELVENGEKLEGSTATFTKN